MTQDVRYQHRIQNIITTENAKKLICVVGGGSSGLIVMKELVALGHDVICFERQSRIGGVYVHAYENAILTTSSVLTAFSDYSDGQEANPKFWTTEEYVAYLDNFAEEFDLLKFIKFSHEVDTIQQCEKSGKWIVHVTSNAHRSSQRSDSYRVDKIAICSGTNTIAAVPVFPGSNKFNGQIIHSKDFKSAATFKDKRVLIVGSGESASDIADEVSLHAKQTTLAIRGFHGHIVPRIQTPGYVTDLNTNRCRYSNPYIFGPWIGLINQMSKRYLSRFKPDTDMKYVMNKMTELNMYQGTSAFSKFGCKNEGFVKAIALRNAILIRSSISFLDQTTVYFQDNSAIECDVIITCTGYRNAFPYFEKYHPAIAEAGMNPRKNFKQIFDVNYPDGDIAFFGFARPAFGSIPPTTEMQARLYALVVNDEWSLPSREDMRRTAEQDQLNWEARFGLDAHRVKGLVDFQIYCDSIARLIGCMPPLNWFLVTNIFLWIKIMCGPFTMHQYRFVGPYANPRRAYDVYSRQPVGSFLESIMTLTFLFVAKALSVLGFHKFTPNEF